MQDAGRMAFPGGNAAYARHFVLQVQRGVADYGSVGTHYWVLVRRNRPKLFEGLSATLGQRPGYVVVMDRRERGTDRRTALRHQERRSRDAEIDPFAIVP